MSQKTLGTTASPIKSEIKVQLMIDVKSDQSLGYEQYFARFALSLNERQQFTVRWLRLLGIVNTWFRLKLKWADEEALGLVLGNKPL